MDESYVRPVTRAREPGPSWLPVLRFRLAVVVLLMLLAFACVEVWARYFDPNRQGGQDPGVGNEVVEPQPESLGPRWSPPVGR